MHDERLNGQFYERLIEMLAKVDNQLAFLDQRIQLVQSAGNEQKASISMLIKQWQETNQALIGVLDRTQKGQQRQFIYMIGAIVLIGLTLAVKDSSKDIQLDSKGFHLEHHANSTNSDSKSGLPEY
jgi:hypothetical protein